MSTVHIAITKGIKGGWATRVRGESFMLCSIFSNVLVKLGMCVVDSRVNNVDMTFSIQFDLVDLCEWELSLSNSFELPLHVISSSFFREVLGWRVIDGDGLVLFNGLNAVLELREVVLAEGKSYFMLFLVDNHDTSIL